MASVRPLDGDSAGSSDVHGICVALVASLAATGTVGDAAEPLSEARRRAVWPCAHGDPSGDLRAGDRAVRELRRGDRFWLQLRRADAVRRELRGGERGRAAERPGTTRSSRRRWRRSSAANCFKMSPCSISLRLIPGNSPARDRQPPCPGPGDPLGDESGCFTQGVRKFRKQPPVLERSDRRVIAAAGRRLAPLGLLGRLGEALDQPRELFDPGVDLAVGARRVAGVDALEDDRQLPVAEREEEVEFGDVAARALGVARRQLLPGSGSRARGSPARPSVAPSSSRSGQ